MDVDHFQNLKKLKRIIFSHFYFIFFAKSHFEKKKGYLKFLWNAQSYHSCAITIVYLCTILSVELKKTLKRSKNKWSGGVVKTLEKYWTELLCKGKSLYYVSINFEVSPPTHPNVSIRQHSKSTQPPTSLGKNSTHTQCVSKMSAFLASPKVPTYLKIDKKWLRNIKMFPEGYLYKNAMWQLVLFWENLSW